MKKIVKQLFFRSISIVAIMMIWCNATNAKVLVPFYKTSSQSWEAKYYSSSIDGDGAPENWYHEDFDDSSWTTVLGPLNLSNGKWQANYYSYWVRCYFTIDELNVSNTFTFFVQHDDGCVAYINGQEIYSNENVVSDYTSINLSTDAISALKEGVNVLCVRVSDTGGGDAYMDFGLYENELQDIVARADVPVTITNEATYPWIVSGGEAFNGNSADRYSSSWLTMQYSSTHRTELKFDWYSYNYSQHQPLQLYIDGVNISSTNNSSWNMARFYLDPGSHIIAFRDSIGNSSNSNNRSGVRNISVKEIMPLESEVLTENSKPLTFINNGVWPWTIEDGYIQNSNYGYKNTTSRFSTSFTVTEPSKFSFWSSTYYYDGNNAYDYSGYQYFDFKINGERYMGRENGSGTTCLMLEPGVYTMEWCDSIYNNTSSVKTHVSNVELSSNWVEVDLSSAGTLGVEVLYLVDVLTDVELLKVKGPINSTDWATIKQMTNLLALDLSEATITTVPNSAFDGLSWLSNVKLPEGPTSIGSYAFRGTQILNIDIPNSVTSIGEGAFYQTRVRTVNFGEVSNLTTIGYQAFYKCTSLTEFIMPNTVTKLETYNNNTDYRCYTFYGCTNLKKLHFSDGLKTLEQYVCYGCTKLNNVHLPQNLRSIRDYAFYNTSRIRKIDLPNTLNRIDYYAFHNCGIDSLLLPLKLSTLENYAFNECKNLKYIELPSYIGNYDYNFYGCTAVQEVVSQSATPPSITNDPFSNGRAKSAITLKVPSFAVVNYKLDSYWYQFGSIVEGDDIDYWKITSPLSLTNNRRMNGKPDIDLYYGGQFTVGGNAPMESGLFNLYVSESNPGRLVNTCESMTADSINSYFSVDSEKWYFITPLHDVDLTKVTVSKGASYVFRYYDGSSRATNGTGNSWRNVDNGKLTAGQGYIFRCNANAVVTFPADSTVHKQVFTVSDVTLPLTAYDATNSANKNWNFVGNPYPSFYDVYYMDFTAPITVWTGSTYKAYSIVDDNYVLRPMEAFFVQKPDEVEQIVFHKEGRQLTTSINHDAALARAFRTPAKATTAVSRRFFNLQMIGDEMEDETRLVINEDASLGYEIERDASKFMSFEPNVPQIFTLDGEGTGYAINERPLAEGTVALAYYAGEAGFYTLSAARAEGSVYLHDHLLGKTIDLTTQDYIFYSEATGEADNTRFSLTIKVDNTATDITTATTGKAVVSGRDGQILIDVADGTVVVVYATDGKTVYSGTSHNIPVARGSYLVKVGRTTYKVQVN